MAGKGNTGMPVGQINETEAVMDWIKSDGHFDDLRKKVLEQLRNNEGLREHTAKMIANSQVLQPYATTPIEGQAQKNKVLKQLREEMEKDLVEKAALTAWSIISAQQGELHELIQSKVHQALCAVHSQSHQQQQQQQAGVVDLTAGPSGTLTSPSGYGSGYATTAGGYNLTSAASGGYNMSQQRHDSYGSQGQEAVNYGPSLTVVPAPQATTLVMGGGAGHVPGPRPPAAPYPSADSYGYMGQQQQQPQQQQHFPVRVYQQAVQVQQGTYAMQGNAGYSNMVQAGAYGAPVLVMGPVQGGVPAGAHAGATAYGMQGVARVAYPMQPGGGAYGSG